MTDDERAAFAAHQAERERRLATGGADDSIANPHDLIAAATSDVIAPGDDGTWTADAVLEVLSANGLTIVPKRSTAKVAFVHHFHRCVTCKTRGTRFCPEVERLISQVHAALEGQSVEDGWPELAAWAYTVLVHRIRIDDEPARTALEALSKAADTRDAGYWAGAERARLMNTHQAAAELDALRDEHHRLMTAAQDLVDKADGDQILTGASARNLKLMLDRCRR